jgi:hypothetical protein
VANRWPPWVEQSPGEAGNQTVNSTTNADVASASLVVTPKIDTRVLVSGYARWSPDTDPCEARFLLTATGLAIPGGSEAVWTENPADVGDFKRLAWGCCYDLLAGVAYTIKMQARVTTAGDSFTIAKPGTIIVVLGLPLDGIAY